MWEKNCLRHGEFDLYGPQHELQNEEDTEVLNLQWNNNSKLLAVEVAER